MKDSGKMTKHTDTEYTRIATVQSTKVTGKKICSTDGDWKSGLIVQSTKAITCKEESTDKEAIYGQMGRGM